MRAAILLVALAGCGTNNGNESCTMAVCPAGGHTYRFCSAPSASSCRYVASDGKVFTCSSCANCGSAATQVSDWCSGGGTITLHDMSMKKNPDLLQAPNGCNGFDGCLTDCAQNNQNDPTGYANCSNDCAALATDEAITLWVQAYFVCPGTVFCGPGKKNDAGIQPCSSADLDPTGTTVSDACNTCLNNAYSTMSTQIRTSCASDINACTADKP